MSDEFMGSTDPVVAAPSSPTPAAQPVADSKSEYSDFLAAITNQEGQQKYKTVADALIGAAKAQEHIQRIESENAELRSVSKKVETLEQVLLNLEKGKPVDLPIQPKVEDQEALVVSVLEKREQEARQRQNREAVLNSLKEKFGERVNEVLAIKANDLGLSVADLGSMAARSPKAVLEFFKETPKGTPTVQGTVNTQALQPKPQDSKVPENIMWGASTKEVTDFFRQVKADVNRELGIT